MAVVFAASLLPAMAHAQRGMGGRVSMSSSSHVGPAFGPHSMPVGSAFAPRPMTAFPGRTFGPHAMPVQRTFAGPRQTVFVPNRTAFVPQNGVRVSFGFRHRFRDFDFDGRFRFRHHPFFFGGGCFSPFCSPFLFGSGFFGGGVFGGGVPYAPYLPAYDYAYQPPPPQQIIVAPDNNDRELSLQVERLSDEVEYLREEESRSRTEARNPAPQPQGSMSAQQPPAYTVLVFRDGRKLSVQNYAVAGTTLWIINEHSAKKVLLSDLDISATEQANSVNGVEFKLPATAQSH